MKIFYFYLLIVSSIFGCSSTVVNNDNNDPIVLGKNFKLEYGQIKLIENTNIGIAISHAVDFRCPVDSIGCGGYQGILLVLNIYEDNSVIDSVKIDTSSSKKEGNVGWYNGYSFILHDLLPYRWERGPIKIRDEKDVLVELSITKD